MRFCIFQQFVVVNGTVAILLEGSSWLLMACWLLLREGVNHDGRKILKEHKVSGKYIFIQKSK